MSAAAKLSQLEEAEEVRAPSRCIVLACVSCVPRYVLRSCSALF